MTDRRRILSAEVMVGILLSLAVVAVLVIRYVGNWPWRDVLLVAGVTVGIRLIYILTQRQHGLR